MARYSRYTRFRRGGSGGTTQTPAEGSLALSASAVSFAAIAGASSFVATEDGQWTVSNGGPGTLAGVQFAIGYSAATGWLSLGLATLDGVITVTPTINPAALSASTQTATVTITDANASNSGLTVTVTLVVTAATPRIALTPGQFAVGMPDEATAGPFSVLVENNGQSTLATPTLGTIVYGGAFTNWITGTSVTDNGDDTFTVRFSISTVGGTVGTGYTASIPVVSAGASNTPLAIDVTLDVTAAASGGAVIAFDRTLDDFRRTTVGGANPADLTVGIASGNTSPLAGPTISSTTYSGDFTGWATATLEGGGTLLRVAADVSGLGTEGVGYAIITVADANAQATAQYRAYLRHGASVVPVPVLAVSPGALGPTIVAGGNASPSTLTIANAGGSVADLGAVSASFVPGVTWANAAYLNGTITVTYTASSLAAGTYTSSLQVTSTTANNSPVGVPVVLTVTAAPTPGTYPVPQLALPPAGWTWDASLGYPVGSCFNTLPSFRDADDGAMPAFAGTVYAVPGSYTWSQVSTLLANGTIVDGDVIEIAAGTVLNDVQLPIRSGWTYGTSGFVQIRSSGHGSLPAYAHVGGPTAYSQANCVDRTRDAAHFATFRTTTTNRSTLMPQSDGTTTASGYWLTGIDFFADTSMWSYYNINLVAHNGGRVTTQNQVAQCPSQIVIERCSFRERISALNKIRADGRHVMITHCDIGNARNASSTLSENFEGHGVLILNTPGSIDVMGNKFSAAGIGFFIGGADPAINQIVPGDVVNMWNKIWCPPLAYLDNDGNDYKNAIEPKTGRRMIHAFNDIRYVPYHTQQQYLLINKCTDPPSGNQTGSGNNFASHTTDQVYWCNRFRNCGKGFFGTTDVDANTSTAAIGCERIEVAYNLHEYDESYVHPSLAPIPNSQKRAMATYMGKGNGTPGVRIEYNTFSASGPNGGQSMLNIDDPQVNRDQWANVVINNNVFHQRANFGPVFGGGQGNNTQGMNTVFLPGKWQFRRNYVLQGSASWDANLLGGNNKNGYLSSRSVFVDPATWNYSLVSSLTDASKDFPGGGGSTDGTADCGYNHAYMVAMLGDIGDGA